MTNSHGPRRKSLTCEMGWRELVGLPDLEVSQLRAKIDTGARTSALHAIDVSVFEEDGIRFVRFHVPLPGQPRNKRCTARIIDDRQIKNTSGIAEHRYVIETTLVLGKRHWRIEVSLADREKMEFDLILGRTAIRKRGLVVNPGSSYLLGVPQFRYDNAPISNGCRPQEIPRTG